MSCEWQSLSEVGKELGVTIGIKHKKINISDPRVSKFSETCILLQLSKFSHSMPSDLSRNIL